MSTSPKPIVNGLAIPFGGVAPGLDALSSASLLGHAKTELSRGIDLAQALGSAPSRAWYGSRPGSLGETAAGLIAAGDLAMMLLGVISWHIPVAMLGAFFIATDCVTSPGTPKGQLIFGAGCGILTFVIRTWAGYPEGVAFAVLLMNSVTPIIDRYVRPRVYGRNRNGTAMEPAK